jgi:hypothetical protein
MEDHLVPSSVNVIIDNTSTAFSTSGTGWTSVSGGYGGTSLAQSTNASGTATWNLQHLGSGYYDVQLTWSSAAGRSTAASYQIFDGTTLLNTVTVNQQEAAQGGTTVNLRPFLDLGLFQVQSGELSIVLLGTSGHSVDADAVHILSHAAPQGNPTATFSGPGTVKEGSTTSFVSFAGAAGGSLGYRYSYDFNNSGTFEITDSTSSKVAIPESFIDDGPANVVVHGQITDSQGHTSDYTTTIHVLNVAPVPSIYRFAVMDTGVGAPFKANVIDPSHADVTAGFTYLWNFGDGTTASGANPSLAYAALGTFHVTLTVTDKDGGTGTTATTVTVAHLPTATFHGPATVTEGTTAAHVVFSNQLGGSGGYTYSYVWNNSGMFESVHNNGPNVVIPEQYLDDASTDVVHGRISDSAGGFADFTTTIVVTDVAPTPKITLPAGDDATIAATFKASATSPSKTDTTAAWEPPARRSPCRPCPRRRSADRRR